MTFIISKMLSKMLMAGIEGLFKKNKVAYEKGYGRYVIINGICIYMYVTIK